MSNYTKIVKIVAPGAGETDVVYVSDTGFTEIVAASNYADLGGSAQTTLDELGGLCGFAPGQYTTAHDLHQAILAWVEAGAPTS